METNVVLPKPDAPLAVVNALMTQAGQAANMVAGQRAFDADATGKADNTIRRKVADIALFEDFLNQASVPAHNLYDNPQAWQGVTWGLVEAFKTWMLSQGYAIGSVNVRLSTIRSHASLAVKAGAISEAEGRMIASVKGYASKEAVHVDQKRTADGMGVRKGAKKAEAVTIPDDVAQIMMEAGRDAQSRRDALLMCLLLRHGLRVGEVALLTRQSFDLKANTFTFYRPKVNLTQTHTLSPETRKAAGDYLKHDAPAEGVLWRRSHKGTCKLGEPLSGKSIERALTKRVELLGRKYAIVGLSAHDCRHYWATYEARNKTHISDMMQAGGWKSPAMPLRYVERAKIANEGTASIRTGEQA